MPGILGLGNALVDIIVFIDNDDILRTLQLPKGSMTLVDIEKSNSIREVCRNFETSFASGGSAANTIYGLARLGVETSLIGKIGKDDYGQIFRDELLKSHIKPLLLTSDTHTGRAVALISPDRERTFATHLGAAVELDENDLHDDQFKGHEYFHIEGYIVQNNSLLEKAVRLAKKADLTVSLDLASYNVVEANLDFLKYIVNDFVDIVFANEEESRAFTGLEPETALDAMAKMSSIAVVKTGSKGSMVKSGEQKYSIPAFDATVVDTNGAGDIYAAGFLYGLSKGLPLEKCGMTGSLLAGRIIGVTGARLDDQGWQYALDAIARM